MGSNDHKVSLLETGVWLKPTGSNQVDGRDFVTGVGFEAPGLRDLCIVVRLWVAWLGLLNSDIKVYKISAFPIRCSFSRHDGPPFLPRRAWPLDEFQRVLKTVGVFNTPESPGSSKCCLEL